MPAWSSVGGEVVRWGLDVDAVHPSLDRNRLPSHTELSLNNVWR